jgi:uncharacterized membrane protein HdeD (DUF308 family)
VAVLFGLLALFLPGLTLQVLIALFGAFVLVDGILAIAGAIRAIQRQRRFGWLLVEGILGILRGLFAFVWPSVTALVLVYFIAAWAILTGIADVVQAVELGRVISNEWLLILSGALSIVVGILLFLFPSGGALALVRLIGIYAILFGALLIGLSFRIRSLQERSQRMTPAA